MNNQNVIPLDPQIVALSKAIIQTESQGNPNAKGASGESGLAQWMPQTWKGQAQQVLGDPNAPMTVPNQKAVLYTVLAQGKAKGLNPAQLAAQWNSGSPTGWENKIGTNSMGVKYNVPQYVKTVTDHYQQLKQQTGGSNPLIPTAQASTGAPQQPQGPSVGGFINNVIDSGVNLVGNIGNAVLHPIKTGKALLDTGVGAVEQGANALGASFDTPQTQTFGNVADFFKQRYGSVDALKHTVYNDPVGFAADLSTVLGISGGVLGKVGELSDAARAGEIANASTLAKGADFVAGASGVSTGAKAAEAGTPGAITQTANALKTASEYTNPLVGPAKIAGKAASAVIGDNLAGRLDNSVIKPLSKEFRFGKNPGNAMAQEGIVGNSVEDIAKNTEPVLKRVGQELGAKAASSDAIVDISPALKPIDDAIAEAVKGGPTNQPLVSRLYAVRAGLTHDFELVDGVITAKNPISLQQTAAEAVQWKQKIGQLTKWEGTAFDKPVNQALAASYGIAKDITNEAIPGLAKLNERYANLLSVRSAAQRTAAIIQRQNFIGLADKIGLGAAAYKVATGDILGAAKILLLEGAKKGWDQPGVKTRIARFLAGATSSERQALIAAAPTLKITLTNYANAAIQGGRIEGKKTNPQ